jgi:hypothetical protein
LEVLIFILKSTTYPACATHPAGAPEQKSYLGLLVQGKSDFDAIKAFRGDDFFARALDVATVPSCATLLSAPYATGPVDFGALPCGYMPVDWDTFVMNNARPV